MKYFVCYIFIIACLLSCTSTHAQLYTGLSANIGTRLNFSASQNIKRPFMPSGNLLLYYQQSLGHLWAIQYGVNVGVLGYGFKVKLNNDPDPFPFYDYPTLEGSLEMLLGRKFSIGNRTIFIATGGGATYYITPFSLSEYGVGSISSSATVEEKFYAEMNFHNKVFGFGKIALQMPVSNRITVAAAYVTHFVSIMDGFYQFDDAPNTSSGTISIHPRDFRLMCIVRISKQ